MRELMSAISILGLLVWSDTALAIFQETTITITDKGKPIPSAVVTLKSVTSSEKREAPHPKTVKTDEQGKIVLEYDDNDKKSNALIELSVVTDDGKTITRRLSRSELLADIPIDVSVAACTDPQRITDAQLRSILSDPAMLTRISALIAESKKANQKKPRKSRTITERRQGQSSSPPPDYGAIATGAGIAIGVGVGLGRRGGRSERHERHER